MYYVGDLVRYRVATECGDELVVKTLAADSACRAGDRVSIGWRTEHCLFVATMSSSTLLTTRSAPPVCGGCRIACCCSNTVAVLAVFWSVPPGQVIWGNLFIPDFSLQQYMQMAHSAIYARVFWLTLKTAGLTTLLCALLGFPAALFLAGSACRVVLTVSPAALRHRSIFSQY